MAFLIVLVSVLLFDGYAAQGPENSECTCVPYYLCRNGLIVTDGDGLLSPRRIQPSSGILETSVSSSSPTRCKDYFVCCKAPDDDEKDTVGNCGIRRQKNGKIRIAVDEKSRDTTRFGEWPWQGVVLEYGPGSDALFQCGCVLIGPKHVLTVAHCVDKFKGIRPIALFVRLGAWNLRATSYPLPFQDMNVSSIHLHHGFNNITLVKDIALLSFHKSVKFTSNVDAICLPYHNESHVGKTCVTTGWGKSAWDGKGYSHRLKRVDVPVLNRSDCQNRLKKTRLGDHFRLDKSFICAGGVRGQDSCKGDGGGPLACARADGTYSVTGLTSWGIGCGIEDHPGVYVDVRRFLRWISKVTKEPIENYWPGKNRN